MLKTVRGSRDGAHVETFEKGAEYEFKGPARELDLGDVFLREGWAEKQGKARQAEPGPEEAAVKPDPPERKRH